jgi:broad specificity phosphatase PhoE
MSSGAAPAGPDTVVLLRHGQTAWSAAGRHTGRTDVPLDAAGRRQAVALGQLLGPLLSGGPVDVVSSPLRRARDTARLAGLVPYRVDPDLVEWDYGEYEGLTTEQIRRLVPGWTVFSGRCPGGESPADVSRRCDRAIKQVAQADTKTTVLVAHGHLLRSLAVRWLGRPVTDGAMLQLGTAAVCVLGYEHGGRTLRRWNVANPTQEPLP